MNYTISERKTSCVDIIFELWNGDDMQATFLCVQAQFFKYILKFVQLYLEICSNTFFRQTQSFKVFVITIVAMIYILYLTRRCSCLGALSGDLLRLTADFLRFFPLIFLSFLSPSAPLLSPFTSCKLSPSFKQTTNLKSKRKFEGNHCLAVQPIKGQKSSCEVFFHS